jgi:TonB family protein
MAFFALEAHYYDGGLRIEVFPESNASSLKPDSEKVIIDNPHELKNSDIYYELSVFKDDVKTNFMWLACILKSTDRQFGDRSNYVSVGIWISDYVVTECLSLLRSLYEAASQLKKDGMTTALRSNLQQFAAIISSKYISPRSGFPTSYSGILGIPSLIVQPKIFELNSTIGNPLEHIESAILNFQLAPTCIFQNSKVIFRISSDNENVGKNEFLSQTKFLVPIITDIPRVMTETVSNLNNLQADYRKVQSDRDKLAIQIEHLKQEVLKISEEKTALLDSVAQLQKLPYTIINGQLKEIAQQIEKSRRENLNFFERLIESLPDNKYFPSEDYDQSDKQSRKKFPVLYLFLTTAVIIVIVLAIYFVLRVPESTHMATPASKSLSVPQPVAEQPSLPVAPSIPEKVPVSIPPSLSASNTKPVYPAQSRRNGEQGTVVLRVLVKADGSASAVEVKVSSGFRRLDQSAAEAVKSWSFKPAMRDGKAIDDWYELSIPFKL